MRDYPICVYSGLRGEGHCQGIAVDVERGYMYFSYTTLLLKTDLQGRFIGSVRGIIGHLGCISFDPVENRVYGSLEYKNDEIGRGILRHIGSDAQLENAFYMAIFDASRIDRADMDGMADGVMRAAWLREVVDDYSAEVEIAPGQKAFHRYGCSGIDGTAIGPMFGENADSKRYVFVAYGVYGDVSRMDNDHQVLLAYDMDELNATAKPLTQSRPHHSGPIAPAHKLFAYTGNTTYGIQNLEYDPAARVYWAAVYPGAKPGFPNLPLYALDAGAAPVRGLLSGVYPAEKGDLLTVAKGPVQDTRNGVSGYSYPWGSTGLAALGDGHIYVSYDGHEKDGWYTNARLCRRDNDTPFQPVEV